MTSHPDVEALAFFAEELLEPDEERTVAAHVDTCPICAATLGELTGVSEALAAAPTPPMPRDVADLLDQRVAEAVRERSARTGAGEEPPGAARVGPVPPVGGAGATVVPLSRVRRGPGGVNTARLLMVAAAAVVVGGGGAAVFNGLVAGQQDQAGVAAPLSEDGGEEAAPDTAQSYTPQVVSSGTVYDGASLSAQAERTLDLSPVHGVPADGGAEPMTAAETAPPGVAECAALLGEELGTSFALVDDAHYGDADSRAWVLFTAPADEEVDVYVVDPRCAQGARAEQSVLARETVQAP
ncbi:MULTISPECIES: anti-sigma factor [unclassified Nocardiopsis]|uniref:anti-sigma factor family protein n=1 Tax=unclassified Nocardiopsis TaxID=2649073 RepID=UPI001F34E4F3|nr:MULTISPECIES: hypothetical protein [unclassified Nocardiopsis]